MADINTKEIDFGRAAQLLDVVHQCAGVGPKLTSLGGAAMVELTKINDAIRVASMDAERERRINENIPSHVVLEPTAPDALTKPDPDPALLGKLEPQPEPEPHDSTLRRI